MRGFTITNIMKNNRFHQKLKAFFIWFFLPQAESRTSTYKQRSGTDVSPPFYQVWLKWQRSSFIKIFRPMPLLVLVMICMGGTTRCPCPRDDLLHVRECNNVEVCGQTSATLLFTHENKRNVERCCMKCLMKIKLHSTSYNIMQHDAT